MVSQPERRIKLLNQIQYNILENSAVKDARRAKEIARQWLRLAR